MTWSDIREIAIGQMGMSNQDFLDSDFVVVMDAIKGFNQMKQLEFRNKWEQTRWLAAIGLQPYSGKGKAIKMTDLIVFDWEREEKPKTRELRKSNLNGENEWTQLCVKITDKHKIWQQGI